MHNFKHDFNRHNFSEFDQLADLDPTEPLHRMNIDQWLETLRRSDRSFYNLMALEVWSIAKTMDGLLPGFWNRFMTNRQIALKQFMQQKQSQSTSPTPPEDHPV